jgi:hypothetical protein
MNSVSAAESSIDARVFRHNHPAQCLLRDVLSQLLWGFQNYTGLISEEHVFQDKVCWKPLQRDPFRAENPC